MTQPTVLFAAEDWASYVALRPVADELVQECDVVFLLLDDFFNRSCHEKRDIYIDRARVNYEYFDSIDYIKTELVQALPSSTPRAILQRFVLDNISHRIAFDLERLFHDTCPDAFVSAVDSTPIIRHVIREAHDLDIFTATIQHGMYEYALNTDIIDKRPFFPNITEPNPYIERIKRQFGFRYGITEYCHPYSDVVFTMGDFFTEVIRDLRSDFPAMGYTELIAAGTPEYDGDVSDYSPDTESLLFLSQPKYENGNWEREEFDSFIEHLKRLNETIPVTIRPHPKDPGEKINRLGEFFEVSEIDDLTKDVSNYHVITTVNSTAVFEGVIQGKVCGVHQPQWDKSTFPPLVHDHMIQISDPDQNVLDRAKERSVATQRSYFRQFCRMPQIETDLGVSYSSSADQIAKTIEERI